MDVEDNDQVEEGIQWGSEERLRGGVHEPELDVEDNDQVLEKTHGDALEELKADGVGLELLLVGWESEEDANQLVFERLLPLDPGRGRDDEEETELEELINFL